MGQLVSELLAPMVGEPARGPDQPLQWISRPMGALVGAHAPIRSFHGMEP